LHKKVIIFSEINCPAGETPLDNHGRGQSELLQELFFQSRGQLVFQNIPHQQFAEYGAAAFIAQDESQRGNAGRNFFPVIETGIGAGAKYADNPRIFSAQSAGCCRHIGMDFDCFCVEIFTEGGLHRRNFFRQAAGSIKVERVECRRLQLRQQCCLYFISNFVFRLETGIHTLGSYLL
jgi:hypothetical protein